MKHSTCRACKASGDYRLSGSECDYDSTAHNYSRGSCCDCNNRSAYDAPDRSHCRNTASLTPESSFLNVLAYPAV